MPVSFGTPDKFNPSKGYRHVLFGKDGYLSEWELNELQKIQRASLADIAKALIGREDGVFSGTLTFNGSTVTATSLVALVKGELVSYTGTLAATTGDTIYLALTETTVTKATDADLQYPGFGSEESSRRIRYDVSLMKANTDATKRYLTLGSIVGGNLVSSYNQLVPFADIGSDDINVTAFKSAATLLSGYPAGVSMFQYTTGDAGYPLTNAVVETYNPPNVTTGYQVITGMANGRVTQRLRQFNGTAWTAWTKDDEMEQLLARSIIAGSGLTGGGTLAASRTLSVSFGGNGSATTVARSDHNHDATYLKLTGGTLTGPLTAADFSIGGKSILRNGDADNNSLVLAAAAGSVYIRPNGTASNVGELLVSTSSVTHGGKILATQEYADTKVAKTATITAGAGLTGGGDLSANRTLAVSFAGSGTATTASRSDHIHSLSTLTEDSSHRLVTDAQIAAWNAKPSTAVATRTTDGLLSKADKIIVDDGQQYRLTANSGTPINMGSNFNANDLVKTGFYMGTINVNAPMPGTSWWYVEVLNHNDTYVTQRATKFASGVAPEVHIRHMDAGKWLPWRRLADDNALARIALGNAHGITLTANFQSKVATSVSANPHTFRRYGHETLLAPTSGMWIEATQEFYSAIDNLDGTLATDQNTSTSRYQQHLFSFDVVNYVERHFGTIPASGLAAKIAWIKANVTKYTVNWYGFGSSPAGNRANLTRWNADTNAWLDIAVTGAYTTNSTPTKLTFNPSPMNAIDANGTLHVLAYAEVSNGTIASSLSTDFIDLQIELNVDLKATLLSQGLVEDTRTITAGSGLTGGGDLSANRTLTVAFGGTGTATTVARSDHNHDTRYANLTGDTFTGNVVISTTTANPLTVFRNNNTTNAAIEYKTTGGSVFAGMGTAGVFGIGPTADINGANVFNVSTATGNAWFAGTLAAAGAISEAGTSLASKYAARSTSITAGSGLTGGGDLTTTRSLAVSWGGTGTATTVARSDHNHDTTYARLGAANTFTMESAFTSGGSALALKAGSGDHVYLSFFARTAALSTRSAYIGYGSTASTNLVINNEISGGAISISPGTGASVNVTSAFSTSGAITEAGTLLSSKYAPIGTSISAGSGLTGGGTLAATRTLAVNFGGTGSATTVARSDHNHDSTYVNMAGAAQTVSSNLTLTGSLTMNGANYSPVGTGRDDASVAVTSYPVGLSWEGNNAAATGYPSTVGSVLNYYASTARNFQFFHAKNTHNLYLRTWHDANNAWMPFRRLMIEDDVEAVYANYDARTISAGAGLTGGGSLAANRSLAVSFGGNGSASTVARSDHNHDASYLGLSGGTLTGTLNVPTVIIDTVNGNIEIGKSGTANTPFIDFRSSASVTDYDARIIASGGNATNGAGTLQLIGASVTTSSNFAAGGTISEGGTALSSKYAARTTAISAGAGLTGGGDLTASRSLAVNFGGNGSATTVSRSDHTHALTNLTDVTVTSPATGHTLRYNGSAWVNVFPLISDNSDVTLTSIAAGELLKWDGTKFINNTLAEAGIASSAISITAGSGLTGGGTLAATRTISVSFGGNGSATTVARSDHSHSASQVSATATNNTIAATNVQSAIDELSMESLKVAKSGKDGNAIFTVVEYRRKSDNVLVARSTLSGGTSPQYTTRTLQWFGSAGTVIRTDTFTLTYDADGDLTSEA